MFARRGLLRSIDARQPEKGNDAWDVVRERRSGLTWQARPVPHQRAETIRLPVLKPIDDLGFQIRGVVRDAEEAIRRAGQERWPNSPHQACHVHARRDAGKPISDADQSLRVKIKRDLRAKLRPVRRAIQDLEQSDSSRAILLDYAETLRSSLRVSGLAPFRLGGLEGVNDLRAVAASLRRCQKKRPVLGWMTRWRRPLSIATT